MDAVVRSTAGGTGPNTRVAVMDDAGRKISGRMVETSLMTRWNLWMLVVGGDYLGHVCAACVAAGVDQLRQRLQASLADTRERLRQLELVDRWARSASPLERRRSFHVVAVRESEARAGC